MQLTDKIAEVLGVSFDIAKRIFQKMKLSDYMEATRLLSAGDADGFKAKFANMLGEATTSGPVDNMVAPSANQVATPTTTTGQKHQPVATQLDPKKKSDLVKMKGNKEIVKVKAVDGEKVVVDTPQGDRTVTRDQLDVEDPKELEWLKKMINKGPGTR